MRAFPPEAAGPLPSVANARRCKRTRGRAAAVGKGAGLKKRGDLRLRNQALLLEWFVVVLVCKTGQKRESFHVEWFFRTGTACEV